MKLSYMEPLKIGTLVQHRDGTIYVFTGYNGHDLKETTELYDISAGSFDRFFDKRGVEYFSKNSNWSIIYVPE